MKLRIGDLSFDRGRHLLCRGAAPVHLSPKAFLLLSLLLSRRPDAVPKADIHEALWPGTISPEGNLASIVHELRQALGEGASVGTRVRSVRGFGYAFEGSVQETPDVLNHVLVRGRREVALAPGENLLGREREATIRVGHPSVAPGHARIVVTDDHAELEDLTGGDSTFRGTEPVRSRLVLKDGDVIRIGQVALTYRTRSAIPRN